MAAIHRSLGQSNAPTQQHDRVVSKKVSKVFRQDHQHDGAQPQPSSAPSQSAAQSLPNTRPSPSPSPNHMPSPLDNPNQFPRFPRPRGGSTALSRQNRGRSLPSKIPTSFWSMQQRGNIKSVPVEPQIGLMSLYSPMRKQEVKERGGDGAEAHQQQQQQQQQQQHEEETPGTPDSIASSFVEA